MNTRYARRKVAYQPRLGALEERCTPTVNSLLLAGVAPGLNGPPNVSIGGVVNDSFTNAIEQGGLTVTYRMTDQAGSLLASGDCELTAVNGYDHLSAFRATTALSVMPGRVVTVSIFASDNDNRQVELGMASVQPAGAVITSPEGVIVTTDLVMPRVRGQSYAGFTAWDDSAGTYYGTAQGKLAIKQGTQGGLAICGEGCVVLNSSNTNDVIVTGRASGKFTFTYDTTGNAHLNVKGSATVMARSNPSPTADSTNYQAVATIKGQLCLVRRSDTSLSASAKGSIGVKATGDFGRLCGTARDIVIGVKTDPVTDHVKVSISGKLNLKGDIGLGAITMPNLV